jgi:hypothetical protein
MTSTNLYRSLSLRVIPKPALGRRIVSMLIAFASVPMRRTSDDIFADVNG